MNDLFVLKIRKLMVGRRIDTITEEDIRLLDKLGFKLTQDIEATIKQNADTGRSQLTSVMNEILEEHRHCMVMVEGRLRELQREGLNDYNSLFGNTREVLDTCENTIAHLLQLLYNYYPKVALKNKDLFQEFHPVLLRRIESEEAIDHEKPGRKLKGFTEWGDFVKRESKIELIAESIAKFKKTSSDGDNIYAPTSIAHVLKENNYLKDKLIYANIVRFIRKELDTDELTEGALREDKAEKGISQTYLSILTELTALKSSA